MGKENDPVGMENVGMEKVRVGSPPSMVPMLMLTPPMVMRGAGAARTAQARERTPKYCSSREDMFLLLR